MRDRINDWARLELMLEEIANIDEFLSNVSDFDTFSSSKIVRHAVVYNLQCIGENVYRLSRDFISSHPSIDWAALEGLRHVLVHDYYTVENELIWEIIQRNLPELKTFLKGLRAQ